ncbi:35651_t:CDS:1, partial [Gigaspora margarita]
MSGTTRSITIINKDSNNNFLLVFWVELILSVEGADNSNTVDGAFCSNNIEEVWSSFSILFDPL